MSYNIIDNVSQDFNKLKLIFDSKNICHAHFELASDVEYKSKYDTLSIKTKNIIINTINQNNLNEFNEHHKTKLAYRLSDYICSTSITPYNICIFKNIYNFYSVLIDSFLKKDEKILLFSSSSYNFNQEVKYINSSKIIIDYIHPPVNSISDIYQKLRLDNYKIVILCTDTFNKDEISNLLDLISSNIIVIFKSSNYESLDFINYSDKTTLWVSNLSSSLTLTGLPLSYCISRKEVIELFNTVNSNKSIDTISLFVALNKVSQSQPLKYKPKNYIRLPGDYKGNFKALYNKHLSNIRPENKDFNLHNISQKCNIAEETIIDFYSGKHFKGLPENISNSLIELINSKDSIDYPAFRASLENKIALHERVKFNHIVIGEEVPAMLDNIIKLYINKNNNTKILFKERALIPEYSPAIYENVLKKQDPYIDYISITPEFEIDTSSLIKKIESNNPKIIIIDNPRFLTGTFLNKDSLINVINSVPTNSILVIDESLSDYAKYENKDFISAVDLINSFNNLIVLKSFSYQYSLAGMNIGYAISSGANIDYLNLIRQPFDVSPLGIYLASQIMDYQVFREFSLKYNDEQKEFIYKELSNLGLFYIKSATNFITFSSSLESRELSTLLLGYNITSMPLKNNMVRISVNNQNENIYFLKCLREILTIKSGY